jgi:hypothetical protein
VYKNHDTTLKIFISHYFIIMRNYLEKPHKKNQEKWRGEEIEISNIEKEDEVREVNEKVGEVKDKEVNVGGRNLNKVGDEIIETFGVDNGKGRHSNEVREIGEVNNEGVTVEMLFKNTEVLSWKKQIIITHMVKSFVLSLFFNLIVCKFSLTLGYIPSLHVLAWCLRFIIVKFYTVMLDRCGLLKLLFTRQENTVIQTLLITSSRVAFNSMFFKLVFLFFFLFVLSFFCFLFHACKFFKC